MDTYSSAKSELADIDSKIAALQQRKQMLAQFIALHDSLYGAQAANLESLSVDRSAAQLAQYIGDGGSAKDRILGAVQHFIRVMGPKTTRELVSLLEESGIEIGGSDKVNSLSVLLSKSNLFAADRINGWRPISPHKEVTPPDAGTSAGS